MKAIGTTRPRPITDSSALIAFDAPEPTLRPRDLLVQVKAVGLNPADAKVRASRQPEDGKPSILGYDAAGVVVGVGSEVSLFKVGDEVFYAGQIDRPGSNAERQAVDERIVGLKPKSLTFAEAAALPLTAITAWELLFDRMKAGRDEDETLLVVGGAGGVGSALIQIARATTNLRVVATASRPETRQWSLDLGAHAVIDHSGPIDEALAAAGERAPKYIASLTQTPKHFSALARAIAVQGVIGAIDDATGVAVTELQYKAAGFVWEVMFVRPVHQTPDMIAQHNLLTEVSRLVDAGAIRTTLTRNLGPLTPQSLQEGHRLMESGATIGKVALDGI
ncbi:zinc-binding alcohol dehydrogenase family protein [Brevundimonas nasdae]|uniref:Zinc-type alcohol dehydrogenase-like protein n=1 Tax=Brevundimonas nasdae TaxID=172043 RepID=A0ABX8TLW1_9CAUL|nr:zinc-binding alcohol dehydrogenase family protein [Brevundimonas nasdae]QYC10770.1 zinc-binding alcohol dehydrogenase family protein [Brevundimonas nasdae]QYC13557.1 zinc-binding alcohol dehydrogenase family protein [Brevundimonas nasdae]